MHKVPVAFDSAAALATFKVLSSGGLDGLVILAPNQLFVALIITGVIIDNNVPSLAIWSNLLLISS